MTRFPCRLKTAVPSRKHPMAAQKLEVGTVVRVRRHGATGTVVRVDEDGDLYVAYRGSWVEAQLDPSEVVVIPNPTREDAEWRGGIGEIGAGRVVPVRKGR